MLVTKRTERGTIPFMLFQVVPSQDSVSKKLPEEDFNFEWYFYLPNPFFYENQPDFSLGIDTWNL
jgi:hypothetical protein